MKNYKLLLGMLLLTLNLHRSAAQILAVTEKGDTIFVYENGTWSYEPISEEVDQGILSFLEEKVKFDTSRIEYTAPAKAKKEIKHENNQLSIKYDENIWKRIPPASVNADADYAFQSKVKDIWAIVIAEDTEIPADKLYLIGKNSMKENSGGNVTPIVGAVATSQRQHPHQRGEFGSHVGHFLRL